MMRATAFLLVTAGLLGSALGQTTAPAPLAPADPTQRQVPAEIVPPSTAPTGKRAVEAGAPTGPLSPGSQAPAERATPPLRELVDELPEAEVDQILNVLKQRYVAPKALSESALKRATLQGLLERLHSSATLAPAAPETTLSAFAGEILESPRTGYVRLGTLTAGTVAELDAALARFAAQKVQPLVLDLRATPAGMDFNLAAEVCQRFCPKGQPLFTVKGSGNAREQLFTSKSEPRQTGFLAVLTDADTGGTAELIAATLRTLAKAIIIGQPTLGEAAEYATEKLPSGRVLRFAVAEATLPGGATLVPGGVVPDVPVQVSGEENLAVLKLARENGLTAVITEPERPRLNEAALVAGENPELDAAILAQRSGGQRPKPPLRDAVLQRALDLLTSLRIFEARKR